MPCHTLTSPVQVTPRQRQILEAISVSQFSCGYSPTMAELAQTFGLSRSTVFEHMRELRAKGLLVICPGKSRGVLLRGARAYVRTRCFGLGRRSGPVRPSSGNSRNCVGTRKWPPASDADGA